MIGFLAILISVFCLGLLAISLTSSGGRAQARLGSFLREIDIAHGSPSLRQQKPAAIRQLLTGSKYSVRKQAEKNLLRISRLVMMSSLLLCAYTFGLAGNPPVLLKWLSFLGAAIGIFPVLILRSLRERRKSVMESSLINVMDLVVIGLEAGMTLPAILREVVQQEPNPKNPLKLELDQMLSEMDAGLDLSRALRGLATRSEIPELHILTSAVVQAERVGSGLAQTFRIYGEDMRSSRREKIRARIQRLPIKMLPPMAAFLLLPLMVLLLAPAALSIITQLGSIGG